MLLKVYRNQILESVVKSWLLESQDFMFKIDDIVNMEKLIIGTLFK